jgi:hypothetical protein
MVLAVMLGCGAFISLARQGVLACIHWKTLLAIKVFNL